MKRTHTPGPWQCRPLQGCSVIVDSTMFEIGSLGADVTREDADANARLIAAAPALFAALVMVRDADEDCRRDGLPTIPLQPRQTIDAAIAQAEE